MTCTKEELYQALTILKKECKNCSCCYQCPLGKDGDCVVKSKTPEEYSIHNPNEETYCAFD